MTQLLERALKEIRRLSPADQDAIASIIIEEIQDEELWDQTFARSQDKLARMAAKAREARQLTTEAEEMAGQLSIRQAGTRTGTRQGVVTVSTPRGTAGLY